MLSVLLFILKIIGIILLVILGLFVALLLSVLFVPVRYGSNGQFTKNDDGVSYSISVKVSWLLHIISVSCFADSTMDDSPKIKVRLFGINFSGLFTGKDRSNKPVPGKKDKTEKTVLSEEIKRTESTETTEKTVNTERMKETESVPALEDNTVIESDKTAEEKSPEHNRKNENQGSASKKSSKKEKNFIDKIKEICDKIRNVNDVKKSFVDYLKREESKAAIREIKLIVFKLLKHVFPQKLKAYVHFGFEDPATTGQVLGVAAIFYGIYGDNLELQPDFDKQALDGRYALKGRIRVFTLILTAWKLYRNKWIRDFISFSKKSVQNL